jgi:hypothetical protein
MGQWQPAVDRVDDVAWLPRQPGALPKGEQLGRRLVAGLLRAQHELGLGPHRLGADRDVAEAAQEAQEALVRHPGRAVPVAAEDGEDRIVARIGTAPGDHAVGRGDHDGEDPRTIRPRGRKADRLPARRVGRSATERMACLVVEVPVDQRRGPGRRLTRR